jgi:hypothetical protein
VAQKAIEPCFPSFRRKHIHDLRVTLRIFWNTCALHSRRIEDDCDKDTRGGKCCQEQSPKATSWADERLVALSFRVCWSSRNMTLILRRPERFLVSCSAGDPGIENKSRRRSGSPPAAVMPRLPTSVLVAGNHILFCISREFLPFRFRIQEFMSLGTVRIEPCNNRLGLPLTRIC